MTNLTQALHETAAECRDLARGRGPADAQGRYKEVDLGCRHAAILDTVGLVLELLAQKLAEDEAPALLHSVLPPMPGKQGD